MAAIIAPPDELFCIDRRGLIREHWFTWPEYELPMHWLIQEWVGQRYPGDVDWQLRAPALGLWTRPEAVRRCTLGIASRLRAGSVVHGIVGRPLVPVYTENGRFVWWLLRTRTARTLKGLTEAMRGGKIQA